MEDRRDGGLHPAWWTLILLVVLAAIIFVTSSLFAGTFTSYVPVTLTSDRAGLVMESGGKVKLRGVEVGKVSQINGGNGAVSLALDIYPDQIKYIPANVSARIRATTAFGAKYVDLIYPDDPSPARLSAGTVIQSENVSTEVNTVFQNLTNVLHKIDPAKLNSVLTALAEGLRGQGDAIGQGITDGNQDLEALNPRAETVRTDWRALKGFSDTYAAAAPDIVKILDAAATTSTTITANAKALDALLVGVAGFSRSGINLLGPNKANLINAINLAQPTTSLLMKYNPELTCLFVGAKETIDTGFLDVTGGANGKSVILDVALLLGDDPYKFPDNLPITGAKGGFGGKPSCGSLPDVAKNWPVRYLVDNTGYGTGDDIRPNPGIGHPFYADYFPTTRGVPEPPTIQGQSPEAPGPIPYPGAPPYGGPMYAPDGTPLYPGEPPAPAPMAPRDPGPTPGSEPFVVPNPEQSQPTPGPLPPAVGVPAP
jgi:phospholipid/cholesterol/gamma-HCH transport system substrate-binding protein